MATRKTGSSSTSPPQPELSPLVSKEMQPGWLESRLVLVISVGLVFSLQKFIEVRTVLRVPGFVEIKNDGWTKLALGNIVTLLLFVLLVAFASAAVPRRDRAGVEAPTLGRTTDRSLGWYRFGVFLVAGVFLFGNMQSRLLAGYIQAVSASPPLGVAVAWLAVWAVFAAAALWAKPTSPVDVAGFVFLILLTRTYAYWYHPFAEIHGDTVIASFTIDRPGTYSYVCTLHAGMSGRVVVVAR